VRPIVPRGKRAAVADCSQKQFTAIFDDIVVASDGVGSNWRRGARARQRPTNPSGAAMMLTDRNTVIASRRWFAPKLLIYRPVGFAAGW
jgi:hypothetical protein